MPLFKMKLQQFILKRLILFPQVTARELLIDTFQSVAGRQAPLVIFREDKKAKPYGIVLFIQVESSGLILE